MTLSLPFGATPAISATTITLTIGARSLPEGSYEEIPISTDAPLFTDLDVSVSDSAVLAVPAKVRKSFGVTSLRVRFQSVGTARVTLTAPDGGSASADLTVTPGAVLTPLAVAPAIVQAANAGGKTAIVKFTNTGSQPFSASLSSAVFDLSPASLSLSPGATQAVTFTGKALAAGAYTFDLALPQKRCCPIDSQIYTATLKSLVPSGTAGDVASASEHVDIIAPPDAAFAPAIFTFTNAGSVPISGTVTSDVPWLQPLTAEVVTIPARASADIEVALNREERPDSFNPLGTEIGTLSFVYANTPAGPFALDTGGSTTAVTVSVADTITLSTTPSSVPPLSPGEIALLMPGMGNVLGSVGRFASDLEQLVAAASVFNSSNPSGTYGTGIPPLRSDRAISADERMYLTGLRSDAGAHTNLYLQEASGRGVSIAIRFFDPAGNVLAQRSETLDPWALRVLGFVVPNGAVSAELAHAGGSGTFVGYATPVDNGGDTWVVADWQRYYGVQSSGVWIVPVAGVLHGAADTYFRTDIAIMNTGASKATGTLRFYNRDGTISNKTVSIEQGQTFVSSDVVAFAWGSLR